MPDLSQLLADISARLSPDLSQDETWDVTIDVAHMIGAKAVNVAAVTVESREVVWGRSSMEPEWLEEYNKHSFYEVDPVLRGLLDGAIPELHPAGVPLDGMAPDPRFALLRERLFAYGYHWFWGNMWRDGAVDIGVVFAMGEDPNGAFGDATPVIFRTVSALISAQSQPPEDSHLKLGHLSSFDALTPREKDVLRHLANGLTNGQIGHALGIAEVTVRLHLANARTKMGATTREQTLALALARGAISI